MTVFAIGASAQSLIGKWAAEVVDEEEYGPLTWTFILNFKDKTNVELGAECDMTDEEINIVFDFLVPAKYTRDGD